MPVPNEFKIAPDFFYCEMCDKCYPDDKLVHVLVTHDLTGEVRLYGMCSDCREKCRTNSDYEEYVTDKVFNLKLGRLKKKPN